MYTHRQNTHTQKHTYTHTNIHIVCVFVSVCVCVCVCVCMCVCVLVSPPPLKHHEQCKLTHPIVWSSLWHGLSRGMVVHHTSDPVSVPAQKWLLHHSSLDLYKHLPILFSLPRYLDGESIRHMVSFTIAARKAFSWLGLIIRGFPMAGREW